MNLSEHALYSTWASMKDRCYNKAKSNYKNYGGRGIRVCPEWVGSFAQFLEDMGERPDGCTLDRIDNNGDYSKDNCKWSTWNEQHSNKRPRAHASGYKGVTFDKSTGTYKAYVYENNNHITIGRFKTADHAYVKRQDYLRVA